MRPMVRSILNIESPYKYNGYPVPRVNTILSSMINEEYIIKWSNSLGMRHQSYEETLKLAADKGTYTHNKIDEFIKGNDLSSVHVPDNCKKAVDNAFSGFMKWWNIINTNNVSVVMNETFLTCNLFGGTMDLLININGNNYLVDFKTSNHPSYRYFLQLSAYEHLLEFNYDMNINGWIILLLNKYRSNLFNEILVKRPEHSDFMYKCKNTFMSFVESYYDKMEVEHGAIQFFK